MTYRFLLILPCAFVLATVASSETELIPQASGSSLKTPSSLSIELLSDPGAVASTYRMHRNYRDSVRVSVPVRATFRPGPRIVELYAEESLRGE
jgi:hypothetical protein